MFEGEWADAAVEGDGVSMSVLLMEQLESVVVGSVQEMCKCVLVLELPLQVEC